MSRASGSPSHSMSFALPLIVGLSSDRLLQHHDLSANALPEAVPERGRVLDVVGVDELIQDEAPYVVRDITDLRVGNRQDGVTGGGLRCPEADLARAA